MNNIIGIKKLKNNNYDFTKENFENQAKSTIHDNMIKDKFEIDNKVFDILEEIKQITINIKDPT